MMMQLPTLILQKVVRLLRRSSNVTASDGSTNTPPPLAFDSPSGSPYLYVTDILSITAITAFGSPVTDYLILTRDGEAAGYAIYRIDSLTGLPVNWDFGHELEVHPQAITVAGDWGFADEVPSTILEVARMLALRFYTKRTKVYHDEEAATIYNADESTTAIYSTEVLQLLQDFVFKAAPVTL
jgi:hypothetical protein